MYYLNIIFLLGKTTIIFQENLTSGQCLHLLHRLPMPAPVQLIKISKHGDPLKYISLKHIFCANDNSKEVFINIQCERYTDNKLPV